MIKYKLSFLLLLFSCSEIHAQENNYNGTWLSVNTHYGFVTAHNENMLYLIHGHAPGAEVNIFKTTSGKKQWQRAYNNPEIGISAFYIYLSNPSQLGFGMSVNPYVNFPLIKKKRFALKFKAAVSVGYLSKKFDRINNFKNGAVGSHLNGFVNLRLNAHYNLTDNYRLEYGLGLFHFSNGAFKVPNLGINIPTVNLGLAYQLSDNKPTIISSDTSISHSSKSKFEIVCYAGGFKAEVHPPIGNKYAAFTVSTSIDFVKTQKHRFILGAELGYNGGNIKRLDDNVVVNKKSELLQGGVKLGYALRVGSLELPLEFGYYIHTLVKRNGDYFHRIGLRYYCSNNLVVNFTLKTHWAVADYLECGIGYVFRKK